MTVPRSESLATAAMNVRGSTTDILLSLYKSSMNIVNIPNDNKALKRGLILNIHTAKLGDQVEGTPKLLPESDAIRVGLTTLKSNTTLPAQQSFNLYDKQFKGFDERISNHVRQLDELTTEYAKLVSQQNDHMKALLQKIENAKDQTDMTGSQPIMRELATQETHLKELRHRLSLISRTGLTIENELDSLLRLVYNAIPPAERKTLVSPEEIARSRRAFVAEATPPTVRPSLGGSGSNSG